MNSATASPQVDVMGAGINPTDTTIRLPHFPSLDSKVELLSAEVKPGGQVASAMVACRRWGLSARYVGKTGDDEAGNSQMSEMQREGVEAHWILAQGCASQTSFILVDELSGERTVLWKRHLEIALRPEDLNRGWIRGAKVLLVDGHDTEAAAQEAVWAREDGILVVGDFGNRYPGIKALLQYTDFAITSKNFPERLPGETNLLKSLPRIFRNFKFCSIGATLDSLGMLAWDGTQFPLCPGFRVRAMDATGPGDIFHGAFIYGIVRDWDMKEILEFSCAAAALNCTASGTRSRIAPLQEIGTLGQSGGRSEMAYTSEALHEAALAAEATGANE